MRLGIFIGLSLLFNLSVQAQQKVDSILLLQEVAVQGHFEKQFLSGNKIIVPGKKRLNYFQNENVQAVLQQNSSIHFKEYGNGMLSTIAFRGTNASQTAVLWNNFNINSFTLGLTDFSLIPTAAINSISIVPGSGSSMGGNGAFGGAVLLESDLSIHETNQIALSQSIGSFNSYQSNASINFRINKLIGSSKFYFNQSENNFIIPQTGLEQENASFRQKGFTQSLAYQLSKTSKISGDFWWHGNFRAIQPPIGTQRNLNDQQDENIRSQMTYENNQHGQLKLGSGFFQDEMIYRLDAAESRYLVKRIESFANYSLPLGFNHKIKLSARHNHIRAINESYEEGFAVEHRYNVSVLLKGELFNNFEYATHLKQQFVGSRIIPLNPYLGISKSFTKNDLLQFKINANTSYNFRLPTLNDRFWESAGQVDLQAENAWNKEFGAEVQFRFDKAVLGIENTVFHNHVENWIQWTPDPFGQFRPRNIKAVVAKGLESNIYITPKTSGNWGARLEWQQTISHSTVTATDGNEIEIGKQLIYTPTYKSSTSASIEWKNWRLNYFFARTGEVFTTNTNSSIFALEAFNLNEVGIKYLLRNWQFTAKIKNVFNTTYQVYSGYAMPGINFQLSLNYQLKFSQ